MSDEEFLANLQNIDNEKLIQSLQNCGHDGYYNDLYYPIIEEIKRRLSLSPSAEPERKKGEWIKEGHWGRSYKCNQCGNYLDFDGVNAGRGDANFCPNCGAKMEETK